jgi:hypothetical protein
VSRFVTTVDLRILRGQYREGRQLFSLLDEVRYESDVLGDTIVVPEGFITDLASVPRRPLEWWLAGGRGDEPAVLHDWLYTAHACGGKPITRAQADAVLREAITLVDPEAPGWLMWAAVRVGGKSSWGDDGPAQTPSVQQVVEASAGA